MKWKREFLYRAVRTRGAELPAPHSENKGGQSLPGFQTVKWGGAPLQSPADHSPDILVPLVCCTLSRRGSITPPPKKSSYGPAILLLASRPGR